MYFQWCKRGKQTRRSNNTYCTVHVYSLNWILKKNCYLFGQKEKELYLSQVLIFFVYSLRDNLFVHFWGQDTLIVYCPEEFYHFYF